MITSMARIGSNAPGWAPWIIGLVVGFGTLLSEPESATAQNRDPQAVFERVEQKESTDTDTLWPEHF